MSDVYVYAVLGHAPRPDAGAGLSDEPLRVVRIGNLLAAVGEMSARPAVTEATLRAHDAVIRRLASAVDAILPVRFGSLLPESSLADLLRVRARELTQALALVAGREQMTLRVLGEKPADRDSPSEETGHADLGPGARYLTARRDEWRRAREAPELAPLRPALAPLVRAEYVMRHDTPPLLASVYHLIDRGAADAYQAALGAVSHDTVRIVATGPWPPYAFAPEALG
jgi:Gas vesicle synthesis protein GvpL/GvpF